jgi:hypothetical protein
MGGGRRSATPDRVQALIMDFFHQLRNEEEPSSEWVVYQTLIADFYHERAESLVASECVSQLSTPDSASDSRVHFFPQTQSHSIVFRIQIAYI